jgi:hypothetical protein
MVDDLNRSIAEIRVVNAEKRLLRAVDHYEKVAAQEAYEQALAQLEKARGYVAKPCSL